MHHHKITIVASGTRGDIQPLLALGRGLHAEGHTVRLATHQPFRAFVEASGMPFAPLAGDLHPLLARAAAAGAFALGSRPFHNLRATLRYLREAQPVFTSMIEDAWRQCQHATALVVTLPTLWALQIAEALSIPCVVALFQPLTPTAAFPSPLLPVTHSLGPWVNRASHRLMLRLLWLPWRAALGRWRNTTLGLASPMPADALRAGERTGALWLYGMSQYVVARPPDWPADHHVCGFWFHDTPGWQPPEGLQRFLEAGPAPLYLGFGSMSSLRVDELRLTLAALQSRGMRAVVAISGAPAMPASPNIYVFDSTPHDWLFPRVAAVLHHGGAGTTAAALRAGVPQIIAPVAVDQYFWGERVRRLGVGVVAGRRDFDTKRIAQLFDVACSPVFRANAAALAQRIRAENGVARAVALIHRNIA